MRLSRFSRSFRGVRSLQYTSICLLIIAYFVVGYFLEWHPILDSETLEILHKIDKMAENDALLRTHRIIVSLSSFPGRIDRIGPTLESLFNQTLAPDRIYLNLPQAAKRLNQSSSSIIKLPQFLKDFEKSHPLLYIKLTEDYGPATKLLPTLLAEQDPKTILINVDDDVVYHRDTVRYLVASLMVLSSRKQNAVRYAPCWYCEEWSWLIGTGWLLRRPGVCKGWLGAFSGSAYFRDYFDTASLFDYSSAPEGCRIHDDVWISGQLYLKGIRPYIIRTGFWSVLRHRPWDDLSIHNVPSGEPKYRDPCIRYFNNFQ